MDLLDLPIEINYLLDCIEYTYENNNKFKNINQINKLLGISKKNNNDNNQLCIICLDYLNKDENYRLLPICNHIYHEKCIDKWLIKNSKCPICKYNYL